MLLTGFPPLGSSGPEGHFLATALPHGLLRRKLLGAMDSEPRTGPARPRPACGEGRQGLQGDRSDRSWSRPWHFSLPSDASRGRRLAAAMGETWERGGGCRRETLTKMCDFRCRRGLRAPLQPRLARVAAAETRRRRPSFHETLLGFRYTSSSGRASPLRVVMGTPACSEARLQGGVGIWFRPSRNPTSTGGRAISGAYVALPCGMAAKPPLRVLCLAGFRQSERGFREKTGALRKALRGRAELVCVSGPHPVVDKAGTEGVGPESGETSSDRKCAPSVYFSSS